MKKGLTTLFAVFSRLVPPTMSAYDFDVKTKQMMKRLIYVFLLMLLALPAMSQEQTSMPELIYSWYNDGSAVMIAINCPDNESAVIYYRYDNWSDDGWREYEWPLFFDDPGGHMIEAYAVADGLAPSEIVQDYFYILMPIYIENDICYKIVSEEEVWVCSDENNMLPYEYEGSLDIPESVILNGMTYSVTGIDDEAFAYCEGLTNIHIGNNVTHIGEGAFKRCTGLSSLEIPASVTYIGESAFEGCSGLSSLEISARITSINSSTFAGCDGLTNVTIPSSVTSLEYGAFTYCSSLTSVTIPSSVTHIGQDAFSNCTALTGIDIPASVTYIGHHAFENCKSLTDIWIPASVQTIYYFAFSGCTSLTSIVVDGNNPNYDSRNNCNAIIRKNDNGLLAGCVSTVIPSNVTRICAGAFSGHTGLTNIEIPASVTSIDTDAFSHCTGLTSVDIPTHVTTIGDYAFSNCKGLTSVRIPASVKSIGNSAFSSCSGLTSIEIPASVTSIGSHAFFGNSSLTSFVIDANNPVYDSRDNCNAIILTASNTLIAGFSITVIPNTVTSIGDYAFDRCNGLVSISIPSSVTSIGQQAFYSCVALASVKIPSSVTSIGKSAFQHCTGLKNVEIPATITSINSGTFSDCTGLEHLTCFATTPPQLNTWGFQRSYQATLHIPFESQDAYAAHTYWSKFARIVPFIGAGPGDIDGDGEINISDVTKLIDKLLSGEELPAYIDVNGDGSVDIADVTILIDSMLGNN